MQVSTCWYLFISSHRNKVQEASRGDIHWKKKKTQRERERRYWLIGPWTSHFRDRSSLVMKDLRRGARFCRILVLVLREVLSIIMSSTHFLLSLQYVQTKAKTSRELQRHDFGDFFIFLFCITYFRNEKKIREWVRDFSTSSELRIHRW